MMKNKMFLVCLAAMIATAVAAQDYRIVCKTDSAYNGKTVYLVDKSNGDSISSAVIKECSFVFEGNVDGEAMFDVCLNRNKGLSAMVLVRKGTQAAVDFTVRPVSVADNGGLNDGLVAMMSAVKERGKALDERHKQLQAEGKNDGEIAEIAKVELEGLYDIYRNTIKDNKDNVLGAAVLNIVVRQFYTTLEQLDSVMAEVKYSDKLPLLKTLRKSYYQGEITSPGHMFIDFAARDADGAVSRLSDYVGKGKYVLVDFWASWCGPCKNEMPGIIEANRRYSGEKFMVLGINISDTEEKFKAAVADLGIDYPQIFVPKKNPENAAMLYNVQTIPHTILFAPDGTILERGLLGEELVRAIERVLNNVN
jgi:thiol-disulfide isomerase/thioredoxin